MGHLLQNTNPEAVERINGSARPLPAVSDMVLYHPRPGEVRQGRVTVPAIVLKVDDHNRHLELLVIHASDDMITQDRVAEHVDGDRGWSRRPMADTAAVEAMAAQVAELKALLLGDFEKPETSALAMLAELDDRIAAIEDDRPVMQPAPSIAKAAPAAPGKRRRGRPAKNS